MSWVEIEYPTQEEKVVQQNSSTQLKNNEIEELFIPLKNGNVWKHDFFLFLKKIVEHIHRLIKKERLDNEYIENKLGKTSARELLSTGKTFYMNPCLDFVLVTIEGLKRIGIQEVKFVIEELKCPWNLYKLHFGIDIPHQGEKYYIDYRSKNDVFLGKGDFESNYADKGEHVENIIRIDADHIWTDDNIYTLMDKKLIEFKFFDPKIFDMLKKKLKKDNTEEERKRWFVSQVKDIEKPEIFIENND